MQSHVLKDGTAVQIKKSVRAKRIIIRVKHGKAELVIPERASIKRALLFLNSKQDWILAKIRATPEKIILNINANFPLFGEEHKIVYGGLRGKPAIFDNKVFIYGDELTANKKIKKLLHEVLRTEIEKIASGKAPALGVKYQKISIRDNISRWGSCSTSGNLSFCWRLIFAPYEITEYLVCHELAHLKQMNHSPKFWATVATLYPDYKRAEHWLKENGNSLYLYD